MQKQDKRSVLNAVCIWLCGGTLATRPATRRLQKARVYHAVNASGVAGREGGTLQWPCWCDRRATPTAANAPASALFCTILFCYQLNGVCASF